MTPDFTNIEYFKSGNTKQLKAVVASFIIKGFDVEIFGQNVPSKEQ